MPCADPTGNRSKVVGEGPWIAAPQWRGCNPENKPSSGSKGLPLAILKPPAVRAAERAVSARAAARAEGVTAAVATSLG